MAVLIHNFTKHKTHEVGEFIRKYGLINAHVLINGEDLTEELVGFVSKYSLNLIVELDGVEKGFNSISDVLRRNPDFETLMEKIPRNKVEIVRHSKAEPDVTNLIGLALNWPRIKVHAVRAKEFHDSYYQEFDLFQAFMVENQDIAEDINIIFQTNIMADFSVIDYGLLRDINVIGGTECLVKTK